MPAHSTLHFVQVAEKSWLVLDPDVKPLWLIIHGPVLHRPTRETHIAYRILSWSIDRTARQIVAVVDMQADAVAWCEATHERAREAARVRTSRAEPFRDPATGLTSEELARLRAVEAARVDAARAARV